MSQISISPDQIKAEVREHYAARIQSGSCCSSCEPQTELRLYGKEALDSLPADVVTTSFGCGNPLAIAGLNPGETVIDLGSGGGLDVLLASKRVGPQGFVYGLDMTDEMLAVARRNAEKAGVSNVAFLKGDIEAIPLPDNSTNVIISNCVINLAPDKGQVFSEAFRVLAPGGRLSVTDIVVDGRLDDLPLSEAQIRTALSWSGCIAGALTINEYRTLLAEAGFGQIEIEIIQRYQIADLIGDQPSVLEAIAPEVLAELVGRFTSCTIRAVKG